MFRRGEGGFPTLGKSERAHSLISSKGIGIRLQLESDREEGRTVSGKIPKIVIPLGETALTL